MSEDVLARLAALVRQRREALADASYTRQLLDGGAEKCARKFGEEALETVIAAMKGGGTELANEAADVLYHLIVLLESRRVAWDEVLRILDGRMGRSGLAEKAARKQAEPK
jgi:phosphoribosyl-ATP pyrophosphohydrolase